MFDKNTKDEKIGTLVNEIDVQPTSLQNSDLIICVYIITLAVVLNFLYKAYKIAHRNMKKKYTSQTLA